MRAHVSSWCVVVVLVLGSSAAALAEAAPASDEAGDVEMARDIDVGSRLVATADVQLRDVALSKGSRVVVRKIEQRKGRTASVDVELADGHVLRHIDMDTIRKSFAVESN